MSTIENDVETSSVAVDQAKESHNKKTYEVFIDGKPFEISNPKPTGEELLEIVGKKACGFAILRQIEPDELVAVRKDGTEHFTTVAKDVVTIFVDGNPVELHRGVTSVAEIKQLAGLRDGYQLSQDIDGNLTLLADNASVDIQGCEVFESTPPSGESS